MKELPSSTRAARLHHWLAKVDAGLRLHGRSFAFELSLQAVAEGVEHPALLNLAGLAHYEKRRFEEAVKLLKRAQSLAPKDPNILNSLAMSLAALERTDAALRAYDAALKIDSGIAAIHFNRGQLLEARNDVNGAKSAYERAASLDMNYAEALAALACLEARTGDVASAQENAERALALSPSNVNAGIALARVHLQRGAWADAGSILSTLEQSSALTLVNRSIVLGLIGDLRDAERRPAEAFAAYKASNLALKNLYAPHFGARGQEGALGHARRLAEWFIGTDPEPWRHATEPRPRAADPKKHIFLVGFPRSGTTLLENILAAHPDVVSLEEKDCLVAASSAYLTPGPGLERLSQVSSGEALRQREAYWSAVRMAGVEPRGRVFIDKMPLSTVQLPVIAKLFPNARILFARRDPRDVVLSCFRRRFGMNPSMYELLTLEGAAAYYDAVMRLAEIYRDLLPLTLHEVRYESLVDSFEVTVTEVCDFLGVEWHDQMKDFAAKARTRGISTPSAAQVARGLNREGQGTWRRYQEQMAPVLSILDPWVQRFGYA